MLAVGVKAVFHQSGRISRHNMRLSELVMCSSSSMCVQKYEKKYGTFCVAEFTLIQFAPRRWRTVNPYPTAFPYGNGMVLHFYQQQESSTTKTVHKVINKGLKTYV